MYNVKTPDNIRGFSTSHLLDTAVRFAGDGVTFTYSRLYPFTDVGAYLGRVAPSVFLRRTRLPSTVRLNAAHRADLPTPAFHSDSRFIQKSARASDPRTAPLLAFLEALQPCASQIGRSHSPAPSERALSSAVEANRPADLPTADESDWCVRACALSVSTVAEQLLVGA